MVISVFKIYIWRRIIKWHTDQAAEAIAAVITVVVTIAVVEGAEAADHIIPTDLFGIQEDLDIMIGMVGKGIFTAAKCLKKWVFFR
ncbi:MAG: hypothetical protein K2K17_04585 [Lachnospiraceae bacterium]|nr:hypothetical protein [Lachnospiraceae bacterium]